MERKSENESVDSFERQGTYYQFLIERKVPNGTLRHIASLINVQYEFIPNNIKHKRQKIDELREKSPEFDDNFKHYLPSISTSSSDIKRHDLKATQNLQLKRLEDRPSKLNIAKNLDQWSKLNIIDYSGTINNEMLDSDNDLKLFSSDWNYKIFNKNWVFHTNSCEVVQIILMISESLLMLKALSRKEHNIASTKREIRNFLLVGTSRENVRWKSYC